ncbi:MAG: DUF4476 domain-containing protein [Crocinitomicaceae bacterium]|nr:DUF4476 domain-containing protein [Crocinitomicaceae bacterium]
MKSLKFTLTFTLLFISLYNFSQSNTLVVFAQDPTPFYVVLDGVKKNEVAETRVVVPGIRQTNSNVQIYFKDESIASITKNIWWDEGHKNDEVTFRIVPVKRGYKLRFFSTVPNKVTPTTQPTTAVLVGSAVTAPVSLVGCLNPVTDMGSIMAAIDDESFDEGKMTLAKQATSKKCLTVDQIKQIMDEFSFSKNKLDFAKYAYTRCYNPDDYYQVNAAFDFSSDKEKLNEYIASTPLAAAPVAVSPQTTQNVQSTTTTVVTETTTINNNGNTNTGNTNMNNAVTNSNANVNSNMNAGVNMNVNSGTGNTNMNNAVTNSNTNVTGNMNTGINMNVNSGIDMNAEGTVNNSPDMVGGTISMNINMNDGTNMNTGNENMNMNMNINMNDANMNAVNPPNTGNVSVNMSVNEGYNNTAVPTNGQISININDQNINDANSNMNVNMNVNEGVTSNSSQVNNASNTTNMAVNETVTTTTTTTTINEAPVVNAAPVSAGGCVNPVQDMVAIMAAIDDESFDEGKIIVAKQATSKKCLTVDQIKQIMEEFSFSKNKLSFAKYAYKRCYNPDDYYQVNGAFDFSSDKEEMNEFINDQN